MAEAWACIKCGAPPVDGQRRETLQPGWSAGVCSNLDCQTRKKVKIKLRNQVRGAEYAEAVGQTLFRRTSDPSKSDPAR